GVWIISAAIGVIVITGAVLFYQNWTQGKADASGDAFLHALTLAAEGQNEQALAVLAELETDGYGAYPVLADLRLATLQAEQGGFDAALARFDAAAADSSIPSVIRELARVRAAYLLVDHGSQEDVASRVE